MHIEDGNFFAFCPQGFELTSTAVSVETGLHFFSVIGGEWIVKINDVKHPIATEELNKYFKCLRRDDQT